MTPQWKKTGWGYQVSSIDELIRAIGRIGTLQIGRRYVWRGVVDKQFSVRSSLTRHLMTEHEEGVLPDETSMRESEQEILKKAREWGIGIEHGPLATDLHLLALLQHHGIPTRLLDVTSNPMTALWFACQRATPERDAAGVLFAFDVTGLPEYPTVDSGAAPTYGALEDPLGYSLVHALEESTTRQGPFLVRPSLPDARMTAQEGLFIAGATPSVPGIRGVDSLPLDASYPPGANALESLFSQNERRPGRPRRVAFVALLISPVLKWRMLRTLEGTYNRRPSVLFPDLAGFAEQFR
jgi:hypothetical protein